MFFANIFFFHKFFRQYFIFYETFGESEYKVITLQEMLYTTLDFGSLWKLSLGNRKRNFEIRHLQS